MRQDGLSDLRTRLPGCEVVALADIRAGTCLRASCAVDLGQETLAEIADQAKAILAGNATHPELYGLLSNALGQRLFVRGTADQAEALCLVFAPSAPLIGVQDEALETLAEVLIGSDDA